MCNWSLSELSDNVEQLDYLVNFLNNLAYKIAEGGCGKIMVLRSREEIMEYIYQLEADCLLIRSPRDMPVIVKRKEMGWIKESEEFADWLMDHWTNETMVLAMS